MTYAVNQAYTPMTKALGTDKTFYFFAGICVLSFAWIQRYMFETKGRSLEDIQRLLKGEGSGESHRFNFIGIAKEEMQCVLAGIFVV